VLLGCHSLKEVGNYKRGVSRGWIYLGICLRPWRWMSIFLLNMSFSIKNIFPFQYWPLLAISLTKDNAYKTSPSHLKFANIQCTGAPISYREMIWLEPEKKSANCKLFYSSRHEFGSHLLLKQGASIH